MQYKIIDERPWQILSNAMTIGPSSTGYQLQVAADGRNYTTLFTVSAGITRQITNLSSGSYFRMKGNVGEVTVNWVRDCSGGGGGEGGNAGELEPVSEFPVGAPAGTVVALASGNTVGVYQYDGTDWAPVAGGGGGGDIIELTKAQYEALDPPQSGVTYIITDAEVVDLDDYVLSSSLPSVLDVKADKQNINPNTGDMVFPKWNAQGVITGDGAWVYQYNIYINGEAVCQTMNTGSGGCSFYAPTSGGTAGQPLLSNGNGAPVWGNYKFSFITQTQYDALTTPDSTTIYFIIGD